MTVPSCSKKIHKTASPFGGAPNGHSSMSLLILFLFPVLRDCLHRPALMDPCPWVVKPLFISAAPVARHLQSDLWKPHMQSQLWLECALKNLTKVKSALVCPYTHNVNISSQKRFQLRQRTFHETCSVTDLLCLFFPTPWGRDALLTATLRFQHLARSS